MKKILVASLFALLLSTLFVTSASAKANNDCQPGGDKHLVLGKGSVQTGDFKIIGKQTDTQDFGSVYYGSFSGEKLKGKITCTSFDGERVYFYGDAFFWNGSDWESGYTMNGYASDSISGNDQFNFVWCKKWDYCHFYTYSDLTAGNIAIK